MANSVFSKLSHFLVVFLLVGRVLSLPTPQTTNLTASDMEVGVDVPAPFNQSLAIADDSFSPTCESSALRALWKWRVECDASPFDHMKAKCWVRAPSPERCCDSKGRRGAGSTRTCNDYWPVNEQEEQWCSKDCWVMNPRDNWCAFDEVNNPRRICECMVERCGIRPAQQSA